VDVQIQSSSIELVDKPSKIQAKREAFIGSVFGSVRVLKYMGSGASHSRWLVKCSCGKEWVTLKQSLTRGAVKSCGCKRREAFIKKITKHGMSRTKIYKNWYGMLDRCNNKKSKVYFRYGGRGISVSKEWHDFEKFYSDFGKYQPQGGTIDRIDCNGDYSKENCRWATIAEQQENKRNTRRVIYKNKERAAGTVFRELGVPKQSGYDLLDKGYSIEEIKRKYER